MQRVFVLVTSGPEEQSKATRAFQFAKIAAERGTLAGIMLLDEAVALARPEIADRIRAVTGDALADHLQWLRSNAGDCQYLVCTPCCKTRGITAEDLDPLWTMGTGMTAMDIMTKDGMTTLTL
jgi:uncharacterized protein involved in oxidation of intracellular sulfur